MSTARTLADQRMMDKVARATKRIAQWQARKLLREMVAEDRERAATRRNTARRRVHVGRVVLDLVPDWRLTEIVGAILHGRERAARSPTVRVAFRRHGERHVGCHDSEDGLSTGEQAAPSTADNGLAPPSSQSSSSELAYDLSGLTVEMVMGDEPSGTDEIGSESQADPQPTPVLDGVVTR